MAAFVDGGEVQDVVAFRKLQATQDGVDAGGGIGDENDGFRGRFDE